MHEVGDILSKWNSRRLRQLREEIVDYNFGRAFNDLVDEVISNDGAVCSYYNCDDLESDEDFQNMVVDVVDSMI